MGSGGIAARGVPGRFLRGGEKNGGVMGGGERMGIGGGGEGGGGGMGVGMGMRGTGVVKKEGLSAES